MANIQAASEVARARMQGYSNERLAEEIQYLEAYLATLKSDELSAGLRRGASAQLAGARAEQKRRQ